MCNRLNKVLKLFFDVKSYLKIKNIIKHNKTQNILKVPHYLILISIAYKNNRKISTSKNSKVTKNIRL